MIIARSVKKPGVLEIIMAPSFVLHGARISKEHKTAIIILAFYFSAMFLVRDHFRCKDTPRIKAACS